MPRRAAASILVTALLVAGCDADAPAAAPPSARPRLPRATSTTCSTSSRRSTPSRSTASRARRWVDRAERPAAAAPRADRRPARGRGDAAGRAAQPRGPGRPPVRAAAARPRGHGAAAAAGTSSRASWSSPRRWRRTPTSPGAVVEAVDGTPVGEVLALAEPLVPRDGPATVSTFRPLFLLRMHVLRGLGIADDDDTVTLTVSDGGGSREVDVAAVPHDDLVAWADRFGEFRLPERPDVAYRHRLEDVQWSRWHGDALHVRLTEIQETPSTATLRRLAGARPRRGSCSTCDRTPAATTTTTTPGSTALTDVVESGVPLVVLTDRVTFSAASNLATDLERAVDPVFVGEPMGGGPQLLERRRPGAARPPRRPDAGRGQHHLLAAQQRRRPAADDPAGPAGPGHGRGRLQRPRPGAARGSRRPALTTVHQSPGRPCSSSHRRRLVADAWASHASCTSSTISSRVTSPTATRAPARTGDRRSAAS